MIDLSRTRAEFLAEIETPLSAIEYLSDITDARFASADVRGCVQGHAKRDLFPLLKAVLSERFEDVPRQDLMRDLLIPLRNALGNAYKHGNDHNPTKGVSVEVTLTREGALVAVTDEGAGFDVALTLRRFQERTDHIANRGAGFRSLQTAGSMVSYENGGRTVLLCFRPAHRGCGPWIVEDDGASSLDAQRLENCLAAELPDLADGWARIESCRVYATHGRSSDDCGRRCVFRLAGSDGEEAETRILTARLHATEAAAEADCEFASRLHDAGVTKRLAIPRPVTRPKCEPRLVLYDFDPWLNLWEYLAHRRSLKSLQHAAERAGEALAGLHGSRIDFDSGTRITDDGFKEIVERTTATLRALGGASDLVSRFRHRVERIERGPQRPMAPIHGAFGWDRIHYGVDGRFYLYQFENCRLSDPGLDLGAFAADLLCFTLSHHDDRVYRTCLDALLDTYNAGAEHSIGPDDLRDYVAVGLVERLQQTGLCTTLGLDQLLTSLEAVLLGRA